MRYILLISFLLLIFLQIHNVVAYPPFKGFDAGGHVEYVEYLRQYKKLPLASEGWELYQPPLYYFILSFLPSLKLMQWFGLLVWLGFGLFAYWFFNKKLLPILLTLSLPVVIYLTPMITNELFAGLLICLFLGMYIKNKNVWLVGLIGGLAILSKATALVAVAAVLIDILLSKNYKKLLILYVVILVGGWYYIRNWAVLGNPLATSVDYPQYHISQLPGYRDAGFFTDLSGFIKLDLFHSHWKALIPGTYYSFFYDGDNGIVPIQEFSKAGVLLVLLSIPMFITSLRGIKRSKRVLIIYSVLLIAGYIFYNLKLPFYSTVKGSFLVSLALPLVSFWKNQRTKFWTIYMAIYVLVLVKNFWII